MLPYIARRLLYAIPTLLGVTFLVFVSVRLIPGDPAVAIAGERATPELIEQVRLELGLDQPLLTQYGRFLLGLVQGDLGTSLRTRLPVAPEVWRRLGQTLLLAAASLLLASVVGMFLGIVSATRPYSIFDNAGMVLALLGVSTPVFWLGLMLMLVFSVELPKMLQLSGPILPPTGSGTWKHLVMPAVTLGAYSTGIIARMTRSSMLDVIGHDYIRTARAKGLSERVVTYRHALRNALVPVITVQGLQFGTLLGGAVLTESVFAWPGLGRYLVDAIFLRDYPVVQAAILVIAVGFIIINLVVDLVYGLVDPRIRYG
ncbi:MAG: ABC transporter permease [Limnochordales bacterium]